MEYVTKETNKSCLITYYTEPKAGDGKEEIEMNLLYFSPKGQSSYWDW